jgi:hypothetical protein
MEDWLVSSHAEAFTDPEFQEEWEAQSSPNSCLNCHTTGYDEATGVYVSEGVTCEQCHGPGDTMNRDISPEFCGSCHSDPYPTFEEWKSSGPSHANATCILCHDKHTSELTHQTTTGTCVMCHISHIEDVEETKHGAAGTECADCHVYSKPPDFEKGEPAVTGHTFIMTSDQLDCNSCHDRVLDKHDVLGEKAYSCLSCHGEIHRLELKLVNGTYYPNDDSVALCAQCHNERFTSWRQGTHGMPEDPDAPCVDCHDPHDPVISGVATLASIPPREPPSNPSIPLTTAFVVIIEILGFSIVILRWRKNV